MNKTSFYALWAGLFILCAGLGFIPAPQGLLKWLMIALAVGFFVPPLLILRLAAKRKDTATAALVRNLAVLSLSLTVAALIGNFLSVMGPEALGNALYALLVVLSTPMICGQYWLISLFLWACLLFYSISLLKKET